jgi:hypothetical protein
MPASSRRNARPPRTGQEIIHFEATFMQDANGAGTGAGREFPSFGQENHVPPELLESVRDLNRRFLDLIGDEFGAWCATGRLLPPELSARIAPLSAAQKAAAATCPYALFDLRFDDRAHWHRRLRSVGAWAVADTAGVQAPTLEFVRLAVFFAWHVAWTGRLAPLLLLGMEEATAAALRGVTIDGLPSLAFSEAANLTARWHGVPRYWSALAGAAALPDPPQLRRVQLYGLQLAAAARLAPAAGCP